MNAIEQATNLTMISKIEAAIYLFKSKFPNIIADLKPWVQSVETEKYGDKNSVDIGFHFPKLDFPCQCRSILMQIRFHEDFEPESYKAIGIEMSGYEPSYPLWQFSTIGSWQFEGQFPPTVRTQEKLKSLCCEILQLFEGKK